MATRRMDERAREQKRPPHGSPRFTVEHVRALVNALEGTEVTAIRWSRDDQRIVIHRGHVNAVRSTAHPAPPAAPGAARAPEPAPPHPRPALAAVPVPAPTAEPTGELVTSPFVGTFYRAPSPDSPPFVEVGTVVRKGQVLCIVEAMKLMNEIEAEAPGKVLEILVANATPVEQGQPLFRIQPA